MRRLVVGVDGSDASLQAARWSGVVADALDAQVVLVNAFVPGYSELKPATAKRLHDEQTEQIASRCADALGAMPYELEVRRGDARDVLPEAARDHDAHLVVIAAAGSTGRAPGFLALGSVAEYLAHHVEHPLAIIHQDTGDRLGRIAVAVDGSEHGRCAARWVADLAAAAGAAVTAIAVEEAGRPIVEDGDGEDEAAWRSRAEETVTSDWAAPIAEAGVELRAVASRQSPVAEAILEVAASEGADVLVVGARGLGGITGLRIGGVALAVVHRAELPVVLVPPADAG
jgi:nucleotide-binding universal stress UspA family protein